MVKGILSLYNKTKTKTRKLQRQGQTKGNFVLVLHRQTAQTKDSVHFYCQASGTVHLCAIQYGCHYPRWLLTTWNVVNLNSCVFKCWILDFEQHFLNVKYLIKICYIDYMLKWHFRYSGLPYILKLISSVSFYIFNMAIEKFSNYTCGSDFHQAAMGSITDSQKCDLWLATWASPENLFKMKILSPPPEACWVKLSGVGTQQSSLTKDLISPPGDSVLW